MLKAIFIVLVYCVMLSAHAVDSTSIDTHSTDTLTDTLPHPEHAAKTAEKNEKMALIKRNFDHKQQVFLGIGMMIFIAVIMSSAQSWNPRN